MQQIAIIVDYGKSTQRFVKSSEGNYVFKSMEEAENVLLALGDINAHIYSREVSPWKFEGDFLSSST